MPSRWSPEFRILKRRQPLSRAAEDSDLVKFIDVVKGELDTAVGCLNDVYDSLLINTSSGAVLDRHGRKLNLPRNEGELDADYRARLLLALQEIPKGLTIADLKDIIDDYTQNFTIVERYGLKWLWPVYRSPGQALFGYTGVGASQYDLAANNKVACRFQIPEDGAVNSLHVYMEAASEVTVYGCIYEDSAGSPAAKLADATATVTIGDPGWYKFGFSQEKLGKEVYYWLCVDVAGACKINYDGGVLNQTAGRLDAPPPSDPFGTVQQWNDYKLFIYADYTPIQDPDFTQNWCKHLNSRATRFIVIVVQDLDLTEEQLDDIETEVTEIKPAHVVVQISKDMLTYYQLLREIV